MGSKFKEWNAMLCKELDEHMECFMKEPTYETMKIAKDIADLINELQEMEAAGAMRKYAEEKYGYDSDTGRFDEWEDDEPYMPEMYNAGRRRDGRGRYMAAGNRGGRGNNGDYRGNRGDNNSRGNNGYRNTMNRYEPTYDEYDPRMTTWDDRPMNNMPMYNGMDEYGDGAYILRQQDGKPVKTKMYAKYDPHTMGKMTDEMYEKWMHELENADGSEAPKWNKQETTTEGRKIGIDFKKFSEMDFCMAMNMMYSDYCTVATKFSVDKPSFYACMAKAFLDDADAAEDGGAKLAAYYHAVVE